MNNYKKLLTLTAATAVIGMSNGAFANDDIESPKAPMSEMTINHYGLDAVWAFDEDGNSETKTYAGLELQMTSEFKIQAAVKLEELYGAIVDDEDFDWEEAVAQIQGIITLNQDSGTPMVLIFGKSLQETLKPRLEAVSRSDESRNQPDELEEVFAVGISMEPGWVDSLNMSISETEGKDFEINTDTLRMTVQAYKKLSPSVDAYGSVSYEKSEKGDDAYAISGGIVHDMDYLLDNLEAYGQVTHYQAGFGGIEMDTNVFEGGVNYEINDSWDLTAGTEVSDSDVGREYLNHIGASVDLGNDTSAYGAATFKGKDYNGVEFGLSKKW